MPRPIIRNNDQLTVRAGINNLTEFPPLNKGNSMKSNSNPAWLTPKISSPRDRESLHHKLDKLIDLLTTLSNHFLEMAARQKDIEETLKRRNPEQPRADETETEDLTNTRLVGNLAMNSFKATEDCNVIRISGQNETEEKFHECDKSNIIHKVRDSMKHGDIVIFDRNALSEFLAEAVTCLH